MKYIPTYIHTYIRTYIHTYLPTYIPTYLPTYIHTYHILHVPLLLQKSRHAPIRRLGPTNSILATGYQGQEPRELGRR